MRLLLFLFILLRNREQTTNLRKRVKQYFQQILYRSFLLAQMYQLLLFCECVNSTEGNNLRETSRDALLDFIVSTEKMVCLFTSLVYQKIPNLLP